MNLLVGLNAYKVPAGANSCICPVSALLSILDGAEAAL